MAVQVVSGQRPGVRQTTTTQKNPLSDILTLGGGIVGGALGAAGTGGIGAVQGAGAGAALGSTISGFVAPPSQSVESEQIRPQVGGLENSGALSRRMGELQQGSQNIEQIRNSIDSLKYVQDEDLRYKLAQPLTQAAMIAQKEA